MSTLHDASEYLGRKTWCPGCKVIAVMGGDCKEYIVCKGRIYIESIIE
jgi:hypothetical protein